MPRPTVLDDVRRAEVLALASHGLSRRAIADYVGCAANTIANTAQRDPAFGQQLRLAAEHFVCRNIDIIQRHAAQSPKNAMWLLERNDPEHFARRSPHSITPAQQARKFQTWTRALVAAVPAEARAAVAQAAIELAATQLAPDFHGDSPCPADWDEPGNDDPSDDNPPDGDSNPGTATSCAATSSATGVPPVSAGESSPSLARPANVRATSVPLPTPTSALPASAPPLLETPDPDPDLDVDLDGPTPWDHLDLPDLIAACQANTESNELYYLIEVEVVELLKQGLLSEAKDVYRRATGATWVEAINQVGLLEEYRRMGAYSNGRWPSAALRRAARGRAACKRAAHKRAAPSDLAPSDLAPPLPTPTSPLPASAPPSFAASSPLAAMQCLCAFFLAAAVTACWHAPEIEHAPRHVPPALLKNPLPSGRPTAIANRLAAASIA